MELKTIAVIGGGVMGSGVALNLAIYNYRVILVDCSGAALQRSQERIREDYLLLKMMNTGLQLPGFDCVLDHIAFTTGYNDLAQAGLIIENIPEDWKLKYDLYQHIRHLLRPGTIVAVNTSCISITKIASCLNEPGNVIGAHFMNPVPLKEMVEVIKGFHTSPETVGFIKDFLTSIGKKYIIVSDYPGFVSNRLSHLFMNEAAFLVQDQVAGAAEIDLIFKKGYGHAMGPCETADLIGLDTVVNSLDILYESYQDPKFRCCPLLKKMVQAGLLGKKSGQGFFKY